MRWGTPWEKQCPCRSQQPCHKGSLLPAFSLPKTPTLTARQDFAPAREGSKTDPQRDHDPSGPQSCVRRHTAVHCLKLPGLQLFVMAGDSTTAECHLTLMCPTVSPRSSSEAPRAPPSKLMLPSFQLLSLKLKGTLDSKISQSNHQELL
ncbi:unnamed protein product [Rangifer tarandus platyrhynchus]|uniref:Uncharacterized protein n=1 Tax=Rangifer tarandus platyrhynchus TaxID=3082113 RepID=A0AC59ZRS2_RANTA